MSDLDQIPAPRPRIELAPTDDAAPVLSMPLAAAAPHYGSAVIADPEVHLSDYLRVLFKHRRVAISAFAIVVISVAIYTFTSTPIYRGKVQVLIEKENDNVVNFKQAVEQNQVADDYYQTQYRILESRALARRTLDALNLWRDAQFNPPKRLTLRSALMSPINLVASWFRPAEREPRSTDETSLQSTAIDRFLADLTITPVRNSRLVAVSFDSPDAHIASDVANALATTYIQQNLEYRLSASKDASDFLGQQLNEQRKQVEQSEQALQRYREQTDAVSLDDKQNIVVQKLAELNAAVTRAKTERIQKEAAYNQIRSAQNDAAALDTIPAILSNPFIQQQKAELADLQRQQATLSENLGPNHPSMVKVTSAIRATETKLQGEIAKIVAAMRNDYQSSQAQEQTLTQALEQQKREALDLTRKGIDYNALQRDATSNRQIFDSLLQRSKETGISGELKTSNIRIVDRAELPRRPVTPNIPENLLFALFGGGGLGVALAFFFEYLDNRIKTPDEVKRHLSLPFLGMVPAVFDKQQNPLLGEAVPMTFAESFRAVRTNLLFSSADTGHRSVVFTSTAPGEGKTLVVCNLAIALAQSGQRVLLIDADMRKPRAHELFEVSQQPGLSNVLVGSAKASESVRHSKTQGLWILPSGMVPPNPAELLGSKRFSELLASVSNHFDWVLIDAPPVMAVTDPAIIGHQTNGVVFVIGAEMTGRQAAQRAIEQLTQARAKFLGAILNRVDLKHQGYYYSHYYRREYSNYYQQVANS